MFPKLLVLRLTRAHKEDLYHWTERSRYTETQEPWAGGLSEALVKSLLLSEIPPQPQGHWLLQLLYPTTIHGTHGWPSILGLLPASDLPVTFQIDQNKAGIPEKIGCLHRP